ncbi:hypothetical protein AAGF08_16375 [Algoriphagus sp. SE2]|uniref:hypothetical protein n=1 Tax=Algoriphagus sp. SE2 TaxID=3141536 RepID=UPI0031CD4D0C
MSALSYQSPTSTSLFNGALGSNSRFSQISVSQKEMIKVFSQQSGGIMQGVCRLEKSFDSLFPLFRGLTSLGKPQSLTLTFSRESKSIFYTFSSDALPEVEYFFGRVLTLLQKEVKFKQVLKEVIENRNRFKSEQSLLRTALLAD